MNNSKNMKFKTLILFFLCSVSVGFAQKHEGREKIKALKIAYITEHLGLTPQEAEKFWPVYNKHDERIVQLRFVEMKNIKHQLNEKSVQDISEQEAEKLLNDFINLEKELYEEQKQMNIDLKKIISAKKIILLKKIEDDFTRQLLEQIKDKHKND